MKDNKLKDLQESYKGIATIVPCCDLNKIEDSSNEIRENLTEAFLEERIISDWDLKDGVIDECYDDDYSEEEQEDVIWTELICGCLNEGFVIMYEAPVPTNICKDEKGNISHYGFSWGYTQTHYIHLMDISSLSDVLRNLDKKILEDELKCQ